MKNTLNILWTNENLLTSENMVLMYAPTALKNEWWDDVTVIIWGATAKLAAENEHIRKLISDAQKAGVKFSACKVCADNLGVTQLLIDQNIEIRLWGAPLTEMIKKNEHLLTV